VCGQDALYLRKCVSTYERWMLAFVLDSAPGDEAQVVAIAQHVVQLVERQRPGCTSGRWPLRQATILELGRQLVQREVTGGVRLEGPAHQRWCSFLVEGNGAKLPAVDEFTDVAITKRCRMWCSAPRYPVQP
jgi:hypothetical protein